MDREKKYRQEQIVNLLRQIEVAIANRKTHPVACREVGSAGFYPLEAGSVGTPLWCCWRAPSARLSCSAGFGPQLSLWHVVQEERAQETGQFPDAILNDPILLGPPFGPRSGCGGLHGRPCPFA